MQSAVDRLAQGEANRTEEKTKVHTRTGGSLVGGACDGTVLTTMPSTVGKRARRWVRRQLRTASSPRSSLPARVDARPLSRCGVRPRPACVSSSADGTCELEEPPTTPSKSAARRALSPSSTMKALASQAPHGTAGCVTATVTAQDDMPERRLVNRTAELSLPSARIFAGGNTRGSQAACTWEDAQRRHRLLARSSFAGGGSNFQKKKTY